MRYQHDSRAEFFLQVTDKLLAAVARRLIVLPVAEHELGKLIRAWRALRLA